MPWQRRPHHYSIALNRVGAVVEPSKSLSVSKAALTESKKSHVKQPKRLRCLLLLPSKTPMSFVLTTCARCLPTSEKKTEPCFPGTPRNSIGTTTGSTSTCRDSSNGDFPRSKKTS